MRGIVPINFILMANTIKCKLKAGLKTYDLKGSMVNRRVSRGENQTFKDQNLLSTKRYRQNKHIKGLLQFKNIGVKHDIRRIKEMLERDAIFMKKCRFLDYSVLLGVEKT